MTRDRIVRPRQGRHRVERWSLRLGLAALLGLALNGVAHWAVAAAIAFAPNASRPKAEPPVSPPVVLAGRATTALRAPLEASVGELASWVVEPGAVPGKGTIILLHGVRMDKRSLAPMARALSDAGYRAVLVDLRGHGESDGEYLTYGAAEAGDVSRLLDVLQARYGSASPVGVYGFSYGAATAIDLAAQDPRVASVVAVSPFSSLRHVVGDYRRKYLPAVFELVPDAWFQGAVDDAGLLAGFDADRAAPLHNIRQTRAKILLIHGDHDSQVPLVHSQRLAQASSGRAELAVIPGGTHDSMPADSSHQIRERALSWFDASLGERSL